MTLPSNAPTLATLEFMPFLDESGEITDQFAGKVGIYAIFDRDKTLQYVGYSRDVALSLKQHLVRQPDRCYWLKVETIDRPSRSRLEEIRDAWIAENQITPPGNDADEALWNQPIDAKLKMTDTEKTTYETSDDLGKIKTLKQVARRIEAEVLAKLEARGVNMPIRFDPKQKESGLLNLK